MAIILIIVSCIESTLNKNIFLGGMFKMIWKKYLVILLGITASGVMWWKVLTTPNIPSPALQGLIFTAVMAFLVWFALGFPKKKKPVSADELEEHLTSLGFISQSTQNETIYKKNNTVIKTQSFDSKSEATKEFNRMRFDLTCSGDIAYQSTKSTTAYSKLEVETSNTYYCTLLINSSVIEMSAPITEKDIIKQILKAVRY